MATPITPDESTVSRFYLGGVDMLAEEAYMFGLTRNVQVVEIPGGTFNTTGAIRAPGIASGSVRAAAYVQNNTSLFGLPGSEAGFIFDMATSGNATFVGKVPLTSVEADVQIGEFRRYNIPDAGLNGLPGLGATMHDSIGSAISSATNGSEFTLGAVAAGQQLLMRVEVEAFTGTDAIFQIEHDTLTGFASPTDAFSSDLTMTAVGQGGLDAIASAAITDTLWRVAITGTFSNLEALVGFAIT